MRTFYLILKILVFALVLSFAVKNSEPVTLRYLMDLQWQAPLSLLLLGVFALGAIIGLAVGALHHLRKPPAVSKGE